MAFAAPAAAPIAAFAAPVAGLAAIGRRWVGSDTAGSREVAEALARMQRAGEFHQEDVSAALALLNEGGVEVRISPADLAEAAGHGDFDGALARKLGSGFVDAKPGVRGALDVAFRTSVAVMRRDEAFHTRLTQDLLIDAARSSVAHRERLEDIDRKLDELRGEMGSLSEALLQVKRLSRDQMEAIASRFEVARVHDMSDAALRDALEKKAEEYRALRAQIEAIDERTAGLGNLKAAAKDAAVRLDLDEVEALLARVDEVETEIAAQTKVLRADNALLRGRVEDALRILSGAADGFASVSAVEPARRRIGYAIRLYDHGLRYGGDGLGAAVAMLRRALNDLTEAAHPVDWTMTQNNLGNALALQGERLGGAAGAGLLGEAVAAYRAALRVRTETAHPVDWAMTQNNLGTALWAQGERLGGAEGARLLGEAVAAYRAALRVWTETEHPVHWAMTQNNLGIALRAQGERLGGAAGADLLGEAVAAFRAALRVRTEGAHPVDWAMTMENLGLVHEAQSKNGVGVDSCAELRAAAGCFAAALRVYDPEHMPYDHGRASDALARVRERLARDCS